MVNQEMVIGQVKFFTSNQMRGAIKIAEGKYPPSFRLFGFFFYHSGCHKASDDPLNVHRMNA